MTAIELAAPPGSSCSPHGSRRRLDARSEGSRATWTGAGSQREWGLFPLRVTGRRPEGTVHGAQRAQTRRRRGRDRSAGDPEPPSPRRRRDAGRRIRGWAFAAVDRRRSLRRRRASSRCGSCAAHFKSDSGTAATFGRVMFTQFVDDDLGCASYLVGDEEAGERGRRRPAATRSSVPRGGRAARRPDRAHARDAHPRRPRLRARAPRARARHPGEHPRGARAPSTRTTRSRTATRSRSATSTLRVPPHARPPARALLLRGRRPTRADEPWLVLTGDSLFVGDAARPDLAVGAVEGAEGLFHSLRRLLELPDGVEVFPGHVAGSLCGKAMSSKASTTIGFERRFNPMPRISRARRVRRRVRGGRSAEAAEPRADRRAQPRPVRRRARRAGGGRRASRGAQLLDVRPSPRSSPGTPGAMNVPVSGRASRRRQASSSSRRGPLPCSPRRRDEADARDPGPALGRLLRHRRATSSAAAPERRPVDARRARGAARGGAEVIDVREKDERDDGYIPGSRNIPYRLSRPAAPTFPPTGRS